MLWMCGMPGLTPGDLIDIDMDAVDGEGVIHLQQRRLPDPAAAAVGRRGAGPGAGAADAAGDRRPGQAGGGRPGAEEARGGGREPCPPPTRPPSRCTAARDDIQARVNDGLQRGKRLDLTYDVASRAETTRRHGRPAAGLRARGLRLPRGLVLLGRRRCAPSGWTGSPPSRSPTIDVDAARRAAQGSVDRAGSRPCRTRRWSPWSCSRGRPGSRSTTRPRR